MISIATKGKFGGSISIATMGKFWSSAILLGRSMIFKMIDKTSDYILNDKT